jgi:hypothetical protein
MPFFSPRPLTPLQIRQVLGVAPGRVTGRMRRRLGCTPLADVYRAYYG